MNRNSWRATLSIGGLSIVGLAAVSGFGGGSWTTRAFAQGGATGDCAPEVRQANETLVRGWVTALVGGKAMEQAATFWSPDATVTLPASLPNGGTQKQQTYGASVVNLWNVTPDTALPRITGSCTGAYLEGRWKATARATGKAVDQPLIEVFSVKDNKIVNDTLYFFDVAALSAALR
jgi:ketosteroid isomerase-like protein